MKLSAIKSYLRKSKLDAIILFNKDPCFSYFVKQDFEHGIMVLTRKENYLFLSPLYWPKTNDFVLVRWKDFEKDFATFARKKNLKQIGVDEQSLLVRHRNFLSKHFCMKPCFDFLSGLRQLKIEDELARIKEACRIGDMIFSKIINDFRFKTESELATFIKIEALKAGAAVSFEPIVASAESATIAHHENDAKIRKGFLVLDFGIRYKGYCSDMTRTIYMGKPCKAEMMLYDKMLSVQKACIEKARPGIKGEEMHRHCMKLLGSDAQYFDHGLGHGIGVEVHERPSLSLKSKDVLQKGNVFTIEPGYYNEESGIGIRIEDDIYLGKRKEILTKSKKSLICINCKI